MYVKQLTRTELLTTSVCNVRQCTHNKNKSVMYANMNKLCFCACDKHLEIFGGYAKGGHMY